jgi:hypothetical protein
MASTTKATPVFFTAAVLLEVRAFCAFIHQDTVAITPVRFKIASYWKDPPCI